MMECSQQTNQEDLHETSTCGSSLLRHSPLSTEESPKERQTRVDLEKNPSHHRQHHHHDNDDRGETGVVVGVVSNYPKRVKMRRHRSSAGVLLNLEISATSLLALAIMLILQMPQESYCVMTSSTSPVGSSTTSVSSSSTTNTPLSSSDGSYSLFPHEDLRTGKKIRFDDDRDRSLYRERDRYRSSYPVIFDERYSSGGGYVRGTAVGVGGSYTSRPYSRYDDRNSFNFEQPPLRTRGSRVFFDGDDRGRFPTPPYNHLHHHQYDLPGDRYRGGRVDLDDERYYRPTLLNRPLSPLGSNRPYLPDVSPGPSLSKLPVGASIGRSQYDRPNYRLHSFNPLTNSFGAPRNRLGGFSETEAPGPELFLNHEQYLEYHRKVGLARDEEFRKIQKALENKAASGEDPKKVLFSSKQPFEIGGLSPPPRDGNSGGVVSRPEGGSASTSSSTTTTNNNNDNGDIGSLLSSPVEESSLSGSGSSSNDKTISSVTLFSASDARVPLLEGGGGGSSSNDNHHRGQGAVVHIHGNDPGGVLATTTRTSESRKGDGKGSQGSVGEAGGDNKKNNVEVVEESENGKSVVTQIPPNFISKSGRQLAYSHISLPSVSQVGSVKEEGGRSTSSSSTTYRTTTTTNSMSTSRTASTSASSSLNREGVPSSSFGGTSGSKTIKEQRNNGKEGTDFNLNNARKSSSDFKTSSTGRIGHALPLVQGSEGSSNKKNDGDDDAFFRPNQPDFQIPVRVRIESSGGGGGTKTTTMSVPVSSSKGEKSGLGTEVTKNRIKTNAAAKIAIIRQQELKQIQKERLANIRSYDDTADLNSVFDSQTKSYPPPIKDDAELGKQSVSKFPIRITDTDIKNIRQHKSTFLPGRPVYKSTYKFPVLSNNKPTTTPAPSIVPKNNSMSNLIETDAVQKLLKDNEDPFKKRDSILHNNDIINHRDDDDGGDKAKEDGQFTLINLHNDQVNIVQEDFVDEKSAPQVESPPSPQSYSSSPSFSDLDHGADSLLFLGSNDHVLINKTLPSSKQSHPYSSNSNSTAASTNFIRVLRVKSSSALPRKVVPLSLSSPVYNNNNNVLNAPSSSSIANASSLLSYNETNNDDLRILPNLIVSRQNPSSINNKTSSSAAAAANYVATVLIAGASINKSAGATNNDKINVPTAEKTLSVFLLPKENTNNKNKLDRTLDLKNERHNSYSASSGFNVTSSLRYYSSRKYKKESYGINGKFGSKSSSSLVIETDLGNKIGNGSQSSSSSPGSLSQETMAKNKKKQSGGGGRPRGVVSRVHAHVSHCPKLKAPAEIICDIHIRERHDHPNPQLTVGWRRKYYNATQPDVLLVLNRTQAYDEDLDDGGDAELSDDGGGGWANIDLRRNSSSDLISAGKSLVESAKDTTASMQDFHDKFNVTLAPGISPMLRSVLLIRGVTAPDCGNYQCEVSDGVNTLTSETLLFLCH